MAAPPRRGTARGAPLAAAPALSPLAWGSPSRAHSPPRSWGRATPLPPAASTPRLGGLPHHRRQAEEQGRVPRARRKGAGGGGHLGPGRKSGDTGLLAHSRQRAGVALNQDGGKRPWRGGGRDTPPPLLSARAGVPASPPARRRM